MSLGPTEQTASKKVDVSNIIDHPVLKKMYHTVKGQVIHLNKKIVKLEQEISTKEAARDSPAKQHDDLLKSTGQTLGVKAMDEVIQHLKDNIICCYITVEFLKTSIDDHDDDYVELIFDLCRSDVSPHTIMDRGKKLLEDPIPQLTTEPRSWLEPDYKFLTTFGGLAKYNKKLTKYIDDLVVEQDLFETIEIITKESEREKYVLEIMKEVYPGMEKRIKRLTDRQSYWESAKKSWNTLATRIQDAKSERVSIRSKMRNICGDVEGHLQRMKEDLAKSEAKATD